MDDTGVVPGSYTASYGWAPNLPRTASTPAAVVHAIVSRAGLGSAFRVSVDRYGGLIFHVPTTGGVAANIYAAWEADLVQGVIAEAYVDRGMPKMGEPTFTGDLPSGHTIDLSGGMGDVAADQRFSSIPDAAIEQRLIEALAKAKLTPVSITVMRVGQPAPAVVARTDNPDAAASAAASVIQSLFFAGGAPLYEGFYLRIESATGVPILATSTSFRTGSGRQWVSPSVEASSSLNHG